MNTTQENQVDRLIRLAFKDLEELGSLAGYTPDEISLIKQHVTNEASRSWHMGVQDFVDMCTLLAGV